tara:strand:- start:24 stop:464 length:441 start_codon:yes stop_codon:yes gene_type:complete
MSEMMLTTTRQINAPVETVFNAWLSPEMLKKFMLPGTTTLVPRAETDPRVGGRFTIVMRDGGKDIAHSGTYLSIDRHSKIVFTWESPFSVDGSTVTLDLRALDAKSCEITLTQVKFASESARDGHRKGWDGILEALSKINPQDFAA